MFIPRHPVVENQFCSYGATNTVGGVGNVLAYAGAVIYLDSTATSQASEVFKLDHDGGGEVPFGLSMQNVKTGYQTLHPVGFLMPGDLGSSDAVAQPTYDSAGTIDGSETVPVGVASLGIWETTHYTCEQATTAGTVDSGDNMLPGMVLRAAGSEARLTNNVTDASNGTTDADTGSYSTGTTDTVARVLTGASIAKCEANIAGTTLYPIRVKLLV